MKHILLTAGVLSMVWAGTASADEGSHGIFDKERFQIRTRVIGVLPDGGGSTSIGGKPDADNAVVPELDISYFFSKHVAAELILATSPHDVSAKDTNAGDLDLGETMVLPPTITLQYHFTPNNKFSPYVGAGINYTLPYKEEHGDDTNNLEADGSFGYALQAGADYWIDERWGVNVDVKKIFVDVDASINSGAITGNVELDPWVVGAGLSFRF